jgi:hypothetical protein
MATNWLYWKYASSDGSLPFAMQICQGSGVQVEMPKAPRDNENTTAKKRTRKPAAPKNGNGIHAENGNGAVGVAVAPGVVMETAKVETQVVANVEEQIRARAYELYLQRNGNGGSAVQDWLRAKAEICGQNVA